MLISNIVSIIIFTHFKPNPALGIVLNLNQIVLLNLSRNITSGEEIKTVAAPEHRLLVAL